MIQIGHFDKQKFTAVEINECLKTLALFSENSEQLVFLSESERVQLLKLTGAISRPDKNEILKRQKDVKRIKKHQVALTNRLTRSDTGIRKLQDLKTYVAPNQEFPSDAFLKDELATPSPCYICKTSFTKVHFFYDTMCPECALFNYKKRFQTCDLRGQVAVVTGARVKIGFHITMMLLRSGATVIATTRFPNDSAKRYEKEADYEDFKDRLFIYGLDLRHTPSVEIFAKYIAKSFNRLDILINNAAQTVRRPPGFYSHLLFEEHKHYDQLSQRQQYLLKSFEQCKLTLNKEVQHSQNDHMPVSWQHKSPAIGLFSSADLSQIPYQYDYEVNPKNIFPTGELDADLQQVDLRTTNSWRLKLGEIDVPEMLEVHLVNAVAPFVLSNTLVHLMKKDYTGKKHIINVTAMEGKFFTFKKDERHPHTNMAKAALNMLTHTSSLDLAKYGIYMNAVDTGWVTDEDPIALSQKKQQVHDFRPPLDIVDGAARVCDPLFDGINTGKHWCGKFLKDYRPITW